MKKNKKLIIFGNTNYAEMVCDYFNKYSEYEVVAFTVDRKYMDGDYYYNLPLVAFDEVSKLYPPQKYDMFVAIGFSNLNQVRAQIYDKVVQLGYDLPSFIHPLAYVADDVVIGKNCILMEFSKVLSRSVLGNNIIVWPIGFISHNCVIKDNAYIVGSVNGYSEIGENTFLGAGAMVADKVVVAKNNLIAMGAMIRSNTQEDSIYEGPVSQKKENLSAVAFAKIMAKKG